MPTVPVIKHGSNYVHDSFEILLYLESHFPDSPSLLVPSLETAFFFNNYYTEVLFKAIPKIVMPLVPGILEERGKEYFERTRAKRFGMPLEEFGKGGTMEPLKPALTPVYQSLKRYGPFIYGEKSESCLFCVRVGVLISGAASYADILLAGYFLFLFKTKEENFKTALRTFEDDVLKNWWEKMTPIFKEDL